MEKKTTNKEIPEEHGNNKLSILVSQDGLCFCSSSNRKIQAFHYRSFTRKQTPEELLKAMDSAEIANLLRIAKKEEAEVELFYANALFTLVPLPYFKDNRVSDYLKYNVRLLETDDLAYDRVDAIDANLVYIPYINFNNFIFERFGEFTFHHIAAPFIARSIQLAENSDIPEVFLEAYPSHFMLAVIEQGELVLCNDFDYQAPEDLVYYLLFTIKQLELNSETVKLHLSGEMDESTAAFELLKTYIRHIDFISSEDFKENAKITELTEMPEHRFQLLLNTI